MNWDLRLLDGNYEDGSPLDATPCVWIILSNMDDGCNII